MFNTDDGQSQNALADSNISQVENFLLLQILIW